MGNGLLRSVVEKRATNGLMLFMAEVLPVGNRENVMPVVVGEDQGAHVITWHDIVLDTLVHNIFTKS